MPEIVLQENTPLPMLIRPYPRTISVPPVTLTEPSASIAAACPLAGPLVMTTPPVWE